MYSLKKRNNLAKSTIVLTVGTGLRTLCQTIVFLVLVRILGAESYGGYTAVLAIACSLGCFGGIGTQLLLVRDVACNPSTFNNAWGMVLAATIVSTPLLLGVYFFFSWLLLPKQIPWIVIILIGLTELIFSPLALACVHAYQGHERMGRASKLMLVPVLPRLMGAFIFLLLAVHLPANNIRLSAWSVIYVLSSIVSAAYAVHLVHRDLGLPLRPNFMGLIVYMREGISFAVGGFSQKIYVDIDKTMLAKLSNLEITGAYSAGYRIVDMALLPLRAILTSAVPQFFRTGKSGPRQAIRYSLRLLPWPLIYALTLGVILFFSAGILPFILGDGYERAVQVLQYLAWLPLLSIPRLFIQTALSTCGQQRSVVFILVFGAVANVFLNLWLIPRSGWQGAISATYLSEMVMVGLMLARTYINCSAKFQNFVQYEYKR